MTELRSVKPRRHENSDRPNFLEQLNGVKDAICTLDQNHRLAINKQIVTACRVAGRLREDSAKWHEFISWDWGPLKPPRGNDRHRALRHVLRWVSGPSPNDQKRASFYFRAVEPLVARDLSDEDFLDKLNSIGMKALANGHTRQRKRAGEEVAAVATQSPLLTKGGRLMKISFEVFFAPGQFVHDELLASTGRRFTLTGTIDDVVDNNQLQATCDEFTFEPDLALQEDDEFFM